MPHTPAPTTPKRKVDPRDICDQAVRELLVGDLMADFPTWDRPFAERVTDAGLMFLYTTARTEQPLSPSPMADELWHRFMLRTRAYAAWCEQYAGYFLHHDREFLDPAVHGGAMGVRDRTVAAMLEAGFDVDMELWPEVAECNQCHAGCHDSPK